jgi:protein TonB
MAAGPIRAGGRVQMPRLLREVKPAYPPLAVQTRTQGTVRIEAILARDGSVRDARAVFGHPLLISAALDAVRYWRYQPTLLNGEAVEVALSIEVNFTLASR